jgi:hypothetical protein
MTETPNIYAALSAVMEDVGAVKKGDRNSKQGYNFRGVDAVVQAVYPALVKHKVSVLPTVQMFEHGSVEVGQNRTPMGHARVIVQYTFTASDGSSVSCSAAGEAMDSGDKATPKAMSIALRTALLQALMLPTDDPEPDAQTYERSTPDPIITAKQAVVVAWEKSQGEFDADLVAGTFKAWSQGEFLSNADAPRLLEFARYLESIPTGDVK